MQRVKRSTAVAVLPADPVGGVPGYFPAPNPGGGIPAAVPGYEWYNNVQEEILSVTEGAGFAASGADRTQLRQAITKMIQVASGSHGQCQLALYGGNLKLSPFNGNRLIINGSAQGVPSAGVTIAATGLTVGTLYYIYAYMNAGVMTLEASATGHSTDATTSVEIKTGDSTRTLVGMARPIAGPAFSDAKAQRFVRSWFNRRLKCIAATSTPRSTTSSSPLETNSVDRSEFLLWADEQISVRADLVASSSVSSTALIFVNLDGITQVCGFSAVISPGGTGSQVCLATDMFSASDGYHYASLFFSTTSGTLTLNAGASFSVWI